MAMDLIEVKEVNDVAVISFKDKITSVNIEVTRRINLRLEVFKKTDRAKIIINMENVEFMDSSFIGQLLSLIKKTLKMKGEVAMTNLNSEIRRSTYLLSLDKVVQIMDTEQDAIKRLSY